MIENDFILTDSDKISPTWINLSKHLESRLEQMRKRLEGDLDQMQTASLRGQIKEIRRILSLADDRPFVEE